MHIYSALMGQSIGFSDFLRFDISLLLFTVALRGVSNKHCLLLLFSFVSDLVRNPRQVSRDEAHRSPGFMFQANT